MNNRIKDDLFRIEGRTDLKLFIKHYILNHGFRFLVWWRTYQKSSNILVKNICRLKLKQIEVKAGIEIPLTCSIGRGFMLTHAYGITCNSKVKIGHNVTILKGATIGQVKYGKRTGVPTIGNNVYIGLNSTIVGNITVGNNVLIAANTFVDLNVPDHSLCIGNPCKIIPKENPIYGHVDYLVDYS
ncbi:serine acetyltransferase [Priestia megaterium]|uniref:serine acetyltransferase n=1 Tax=Priestia megaterium TaxID=1404 RepID=UPI0039A112CA